MGGFGGSATGCPGLPSVTEVSRLRGKPFEGTVCSTLAKQMSAQGACSVPKQLQGPVFSSWMIYFIPDSSAHCQGTESGQCFSSGLDIT